MASCCCCCGSDCSCCQASKRGSKTSLDKGKDGNHERPERNSFESEIKELFRIFDTNNDRSISLHELGKAMRYLGMSPTQQQIQDAMKTLDKNDNGRIDFQEFYAFMQAEMSKFQDDEFMHQEDVIRSAFKTFDKDGNGFIDAKELRVAMKKLGETLTDKELEDMMKQADIDGDGRINYEEFVKIWCEAN